MVKLNQIIYKTNNGKLYQYEVIEINENLQKIKIKSFSSGYIKTCTFSDISSYQTIIPKYESIAKIIDFVPTEHCH